MKLKTRKQDGAPIDRAQAGAPNALPLSTLATIYGCCGLFDVCSDDALMSLALEGSSAFLDWIGWERSDVCHIVKNFIDYVAPDGTKTGSPSVSALADACATPTSVEFCTCDFTLDDFGRLRKAGPVRDLTKTGLRYCEKQPRYRLDGTQINDDEEFDMLLAMEVLLQDLKRYVVTGNSLNANGEFDGLERLVRNGYRCSNGQRNQLMDSIILNWNGHNMSGGAGITWNGAAVGATFNLIDVLAAAYRRIRQRISWAPPLAAQQMQVGDMVLVMPQDYIDSLLNFFTAWRIFPGTQYNETNMQNLEARTYRDKLMGGMFGAGRIFLHGFEIPIMPFDWGLLKGNSRFDMYLLTGQVGAIKTLQGQYNDMAKVATKHPALYDATDGGRVLTWLDNDETCAKRVVEMQPRLLSWAPWANVRIQNVTSALVNGPVGPDPTESSFFVQSSMCVAGCA